MIFLRSKKEAIINTSDIIENNVFIIKKAIKTSNYNVVDGTCIKGCFSINDKIILRENNCDIAEGYITSIITPSNIEIECTKNSKSKEFVLYIILDNEEKITKKNIIIKN